VIFLLGLAVTLQIRATLVERLREEMTWRGGAVARDVAGHATDLILTDNLLALNDLVRSTVANNEDLRYAFVLGRNGQPLVYTFSDHVPPDLLNANTVGPEERFRAELLETEEGLIHDAAAPILEGKAGIARVGLSEKRLEAIVRDTTWLLLIVTVFVSLVGVAGAYLLTLVLTKPILQLVEVTRAVGKGDFSRQAPVWATDEIGRLSVAFNAMTAALGRSRAEIEEYNRQLVWRNQELSALYAVALTVSRSLRLEDILNGALAKVLEVMQLRAGWIFLQDDQGGRLVLAAQQGLSADFVREEAEREMGACICREVMDSGEARIIDDMLQCLRLPRQVLEREGLRTHASVPLTAKDQVLGAINVARHDDRRFTEDELRLLHSFGHQIGIAIENARLYEEVQQKEQARRELIEKLILAQEEERKRVARDLHDEVSQSLTALIIGLGRAEESLPPELQPVTDQLAQIRDLTAKVLEETRRLMVDLRPSLLDDLGLVPAIHWYAKTHLKEAGVEAGVEVVGSRRRLPPLVETALFRVIQEAISNIVKHAEAKRVWIRLEFKESAVAARIEDDGKGFRPQEPNGRRSLGLLGMTERVTLLGGTFRIDSAPGQGTRISIEIHLPD
ncbi:MAG: GAF domain-containing protein, partial [Chloroflexi bacterium]|nr:GAF domain-containing protein [Chloroflexota bacterium]